MCKLLLKFKFLKKKHYIFNVLLIKDFTFNSVYCEHPLKKNVTPNY